jgi:RNA polymerase-binding transcription factor DksA
MKTPRRTSTGDSQPRASDKTSRVEVEPCTPNSCGPEKVPPQWAWHYRTLMHLRDRVEQAHAEHASQAATPPDKESNDPADTSQDRSDRDLLWAELGAESDKLFEIDCALRRIRDGVYGFCEVTGHAIPPERLRAVPWTRLSLAAAAAREVRSRRIG